MKSQNSLLEMFFRKLAEVFTGTADIEKNARGELLAATCVTASADNKTALKAPFFDIMSQNDAHPICDFILRMNFNWSPPTTIDEVSYIRDSINKSHVELIGPSGIVNSNSIQIGLYGMLAHNKYGIRTHPAEEVYIMLAGEVFWKVGNTEYLRHTAGQRSYHPSMAPHANKTENKAFMSVYVWQGDISTKNYVYNGQAS